MPSEHRKSSDMIHPIKRVHGREEGKYEEIRTDTLQGLQDYSFLYYMDAQDNLMWSSFSTLVYNFLS